MMLKRAVELAMTKYKDFYELSYSVDIRYYSSSMELPMYKTKAPQIIRPDDLRRLPVFKKR